MNMTNLEYTALRGLNTLANRHRVVHDCSFFVNLNSKHNTYFLYRLLAVQNDQFCKHKKENHRTE